MPSPHQSPPSSPSSLPPSHLLRRSIFLASRGRTKAALQIAHHACDAHEAISADTGVVPYLVQIGSLYHTIKEYTDAEAVLRRAINLDPSDAEALCGLALVLKAIDPINLLESLDLLRRARAAASDREKSPDDSRVIPSPIDDISHHLAALLTDVGVRLKMAGLPGPAIQNYEEALDVCPTYSQALYNLGVAYTDAAEPAKARNCYEHCLQVNSAHVEAWCNLGVLHRNSGNIDLATQAYERALSVNPNFDLAKTNLAVALCEQGTACKEKDRNQARRLYKKSLALHPSFADAHYNLGVWYAEASKLQRAIVSYNLAIKFNPSLTEAYNNLGVVHKELGNMQMAIECYKRALQCNKQHHQTHNNIAVVYTLLGNVDDATHHLQLANSLSPQYAEAHNNMGVLLRDQGDIDSAIRHYERCTELDSRAVMAAQNRLHALSYSEKWTKAEVYHQHKLWGIAFQERIDKEIIEAASSAHANNPIAVHLLRCLENPPAPDPTKPRGPRSGHPLRVGFLSPDFFTHSVSYFAEVLLTYLDTEGFKIYAYANVAQPDGKTQRFRTLLGEHWRNIWGLSASAAAELIINDQIDILIELAGHTANNRLDIMALRLAPVQITWIGYPNTTGLSTIHYRVTDGVVDPPNTTQHFSEKLWRLPVSFLCYTPAQDAPEESSPPPCLLSGGIVTFGSFNVLAKIQSRTIKLWAEILNRVPHSRLLLKAKPFGSSTAKKRMEKLFEEEGISTERLDLVPLIPATRSHLQVYSNVDIALDPFPYAGTTTTCEALYMGVPVITLGVKPEHGDHAHNVGVTLLTSIGHPELVAFSEEDYVEKAVELGTDVQRLKKVRRRLRRDMMDSPLGQSRRYVRKVERMFCDMWVERGGQVADAYEQADDTQVDDAQFSGMYNGTGMGEESAGSTTPPYRTASEDSADQTEESPIAENCEVPIEAEKKGRVMREVEGAKEFEEGLRQ